GEEVPLIRAAAELIARADRLLVVGTSLQVYPAAGLVHHAPQHISVFVVDPSEQVMPGPGARHIKAKASQGVPQLAFDWGIGIL
ncbi:MAG: NAD-dependent deacylase, partial [Flavobacteriales bacterium]|nr:NAD-dependent deacylase [Flavobacteriales bacterium]